MTQPVYLTLLLAMTAAIAPAAQIWTVNVSEPAHHPILDKGLATLPIWGISDLHRDLGRAGICWKAGGASGAMPHLFTADSSRKAGEIVWS